MTAHHLHATAALASVRAALAGITTHAAREARQDAPSALDAAPVLRSTTWGVRQGVGGHGDPTIATVALLDRDRREVTWADRHAIAQQRLDWVAGQFTPGTGPALDRLADRLPKLLPGTAAILARHLDQEDALLRRADWLGEPRPTRPLPGQCPACGTRSLLVQTAGPEDAWTVVCGGRWDNGVHNPCLCVGGGCRCGQPGAVEGVAHIWWRADVLRAVAGAAPTQP